MNLLIKIIEEDTRKALELLQGINDRVSGSAYIFRSAAKRDVGTVTEILNNMLKKIHEEAESS